MARSPPRRAYIRFTRWRRRRFLGLLEESGNARMAAELAGVGIKAVYRLRTKEPAFAAAMDAARAAADRRMARGDAASPESERDGLAVRRGPGGRLRLMAAGPHSWEPRHDSAFLLHLRGNGNVAASARAIGFTPKAAHDRRKARPAFAAAWRPALREARMRLESRLLEAAMAAAGVTYCEAFEGEPPEGKFDPWLALAALKYWDRRKRRPGPDPLSG